jgi:hypothetical protein
MFPIIRLEVVFINVGGEDFDGLHESSLGFFSIFVSIGISVDPKASRFIRTRLWMEAIWIVALLTPSCAARLLLCAGTADVETDATYVAVNFGVTHGVMMLLRNWLSEVKNIVKGRVHDGPFMLTDG